MSWKDYSQNPTALDSAGVAFVHGWEGKRNKAYRDSAGIWTIGTGFIRYLTGHRRGTRVQEGDYLTDAEIETEFRAQIQVYEQAVTDVVRVKLNQSQFNALVSLCYNIGVGAFTRSTVIRELNNGRYVAASRAFSMWNKAGGRVVQGLVNRREAEAKLFLSEG